MKNEIIVVSDPKSPEAEVFRNLRTNIQFMNTDSKKKVMLVTSTVPGEGKSYITANLAAAFAQMDKRVLIIDADMRKGRQYKLFNVKSRPGISNFLSGVTEQDFFKDKENIFNYIQETDIKNLFVITAGNVPPNPSELIISNKLKSATNSLIAKFDIVIFDAPPALIVTDALLLVRLVDFTVLVTSQNETRIENLMKAKTSIENVGGKIAGIVLNKVKIGSKAYYKKTYYYEDKSSFSSKPKRRK